jgi:signal transduction histidine kinase
VAKRTRILISGKAGKLQDAVIGSLGGRSGFVAELVSPGPQLLELAQSGSCAGAIFVLGSEQDLESIRWLIESNSSLPVIAVLTEGSAKFRKELQAEGVSEVIVTRGLSAAELRRLLQQRLAAAALIPQAAAAITTDLHSIRSSLTAIQGQAELALAEARRSSPRRKPLEEIVREVTQVEGLLRRIERKVKPRGPLPPK